MAAQTNNREIAWPDDATIKWAQEQIARAQAPGGNGIDSISVTTVLIAVEGQQTRAINRLAGALEAQRQAPLSITRDPKLWLKIASGGALVVFAATAGLAFGLGRLMGA